MRIRTRKIPEDAVAWPGMAARSIELGPTGRIVATNVARFRGVRGLRLAGLSERMTAVGRPMSVTTLSAIENGDRRADVDDLVALSAALSVSPAAMLMPPVTDPYDTAGATVSPLGAPEAGPLWDWLTATAPLDAPLLAEERDDVAAEVWRREQVPPWSYRSRTVERG
jgi:transcriptional regulator with XRE-family HTH domain